MMHAQYLEMVDFFLDMLIDTRVFFRKQKCWCYEWSDEFNTAYGVCHVLHMKMKLTRRMGFWMGSWMDADTGAWPWLTLIGYVY